MLQCPSDPADPLFDSLLPDGTVAKVAGLNYMYSYGSGTGTNYDDRYPTDGFVWENSFARLAAITDGLSNTVMLSETLKGDKIISTGPMPSRPHRRIGSWGGSTGNPVGTPGFALGGATIRDPDLATISASLTSWRGLRGENWIRGVPYSVVTNGYLTPNSRIPDINVHGRGWFGPRSMHSGGAQVTLGDGSTHLLSDGIVAVWMETLYRHRHSMAPNFWSVHAYPSLRMRIVVASRTAVLIWPRWSRASLSFYGVRRKSLAIMPAQSSAAIALTTLAKREFSIAWMSTADKPTTPSDLGRSVGVPRS